MNVYISSSMNTLLYIKQLHVTIQYLLYHCVVKLLLHNPLFLSIHCHWMNQHWGELSQRIPKKKKKSSICVFQQLQVFDP